MEKENLKQVLAIIEDLEDLNIRINLLKEQAKTSQELNINIVSSVGTRLDLDDLFTIDEIKQAAIKKLEKRKKHLEKLLKEL